MKKFGFAITATGLAAAIVGLASPAQAAVTAAEATAVQHASISVPAGIDHLDWLNDIQPKVNVPKVDTSVRHSGSGR